jgi:hypothetical protein
MTDVQEFDPPDKVDVLMGIIRLLLTPDVTVWVRVSPQLRNELLSFARGYKA